MSYDLRFFIAVNDGKSGTSLLSFPGSDSFYVKYVTLRKRMLFLAAGCRLFHSIQLTD